MTTRTIQDLLAERRANALEAYRSTDPVARATLDAHTAVIDGELACRLSEPGTMAAILDDAGKLFALAAEEDRLEAEWGWLTDPERTTTLPAIHPADLVSDEPLDDPTPDQLDRALDQHRETRRQCAIDRDRYRGGDS